MKRIAFFASFVGAFFLLAGASYFLLLKQTHAVTIPGLVGYWTFDGNASDTSGNANNATLLNGATYNSTGKIGQALSLDGVNDYAQIPSSVNYDAASGGTWSFWFKTDGTWSDTSGGDTLKHRATIINRSDTVSERNGLDIHIEPNPAIGTDSDRFSATTQNASGKICPAGLALHVVSTSNLYDDNAWHLVTLTFSRLSGGVSTLYMDGVSMASCTNSTAWSFKNQPIQIGISADKFYEHYKGLVDDLRVYNRILTSAEVSTLYTPPADTVAPSIPVSLSATAISSSQIDLSWTASTDNVGVVGYKVFRNGIQIATVTGGTSYSNIGLSASTLYSYTVSAYDSVPNDSAQSSSASATTQAPPDISAPTVSITVPAAGATVSGTITVSASASDNVGVAGVQFKVDGINLGAENTTSPYSVSWSTGNVSNGTHTLTAVARDLAGNITTSAAVTVTVNNISPDVTPPSVPAGVSATAISSSQIDLSWLASSDNSGTVAGYKVYRNGAQIATVTTLSYSDTTCVPATSYAYTISAYDTAGNDSAQSTSVSATTPVPPDTVAPSVPGGLVVTAMSPSQINLSWNPSTDNIGVSGYKIFRDGVQITTITGTSYSNIGLSASTPYAYTVSAFDVSGNDSAQSESIGATTQDIPDITPPTVSVTSPPNGSSVSATITVSATAGDDIGVAGVQFKVDGINLGAESVILPYSILWTTGSVSNGTHTLTAVARDLAGNITTSAAVTVTVGNISPDITSPTIPAGLSAGAVSLSQINVSWTASTDNPGTVAGYKVYRNGVQIATVTTLSYSDTTCVAATSYAYTVSAYDAAGNDSAQSTSVSATTPAAPVAPTAGGASGGTTSATDTTAPIVTSVRAENILGAGTQIKWTTDDLADSSVQFGTVPGEYSTMSVWRCDEGGGILVTTHCVNLTNLASEAPYYYKVISKNSSGYETRSSEYNFVAGFHTSVTTTPSPAPSTTFTPVKFFLTQGTPVCKSGHTVLPVSFSVSPDAGGYFTVNNQHIYATTADFPSGTYAWKGVSNVGYALSGTVSGTFTVPVLSSCSSFTTTPITTATTNNETVAKPQIAAVIPSVDSLPQPASYQGIADLLKQKYQEAETAFRKVNNLPLKSVVPEEAKRSIIQDMHGQFPILSQASESILLGTTTLSRVTDSKQIVAEVSSVIALRNGIALSDTDTDGILDFDETNIYGTDATKSDTDGDGIKDGDELLTGTDPLKKVVTPLPYENPKEVAVTAKPDSKKFSVDTMELILATSTESGAGSNQRIAISGTALPNSFLTLYIFSTPIVITIKTDNEGKWTYILDKELENGNHEIYMAMAESAGKIIVKSDPIPFVKTAQATTLSSDFALATPSSSESSAGFFRSGTLVLSLAALFIILVLSFLVISFVSKKKE